MPSCTVSEEQLLDEEMIKGSAKALLPLLYCVIVSLLPISSALGETLLKGTVTAKRGESYKVEYDPHVSVGPKVGDRVVFKKELAGFEVKAGQGEVTEVDERFVWVGNITGRGRPQLRVTGIIHATGKPFVKPPPTARPRPERNLEPGRKPVVGRVKPVEENPAKLLGKAREAIGRCQVDVTSQYIARLRMTGDATAGAGADQLMAAVTRRRAEMTRHRGYLKALADVVDQGDIEIIKSRIRTAMGSVTCPQDKQRLKRVILDIKQLLKLEAEANRAAMSEAIANTRAYQRQRSEQRRQVGESILGILNQIDRVIGDAPR